jgi:DNA repair photolyase
MGTLEDIREREELLRQAPAGQKDVRKWPKSPGVGCLAGCVACSATYICPKHDVGLLPPEERAARKPRKEK